MKVTSKTIAIDLVITFIVFILFTLWFRPHVMDDGTSTMGWFWAAFTALPAAGTFWLSMQMFKVTLAHQKKVKQEKGE